MEKMNSFNHIYDPPYYLHKVSNYQKAVYERKGHWTEKEKIKYGVFLQIFRDKFEDRANPILNKMFRVMSDFMKTRNHNQCRSHHQKMERERFEIESILESIKSKYHPRQYELFFEKYSRHIKAVNVEIVLNEKGFTPHKNVEKRRKIRMAETQAKQINQQLRKKEPIQALKVSKIENNDSIYEVLKSVVDEVPQLEKKQIQLQKQNRPQIQISSKSKEEHVEEPIVEKTNNFLAQNETHQKNQKPLMKTGLQYDSDSDNFNVNEKPKVAYVQIPINLPTSQQKFGLGHNMNLGMGMTPQFPNSMTPMSLGSQISVPNFEAYQNLDSQFPPPYRMGSNNFGYEENYTVSLKDLEERKKWHLSEASRLCAQMNEHLQRANTCEQMKQMMMKQMMELRRGYFYPNAYASTQF